MSKALISEDEILERFLRPLAADAEGALGLRDDAALLKPKPGMELVLTADTLVAGTHFFADDPADTIAIKAITANLSDLVAKGAVPVGYLLALALPKDCSEAWMADFTKGLAAQISGQLLGGDLTRTSGPLTISITAIGEVPEGRMRLRSTAGEGEAIFLGGTIGASALGLRLLSDPNLAGEWGLNQDAAASLIDAYRAPCIERAAERASLIAQTATASMDVSDGLLIDLNRLCKASGIGARVDAADIPLDPIVQSLIEKGSVKIMDIMTGGDDYVPLFTVPDAKSLEFAASSGNWHRIGVAVPASEGLTVVGNDNLPLTLPDRLGYDHFLADSR